MKRPLYLGLMSGTSMDAVDCALVEFPAQGGLRLLDFHAPPLPGALRQRLLELCAAATSSLRELGELDVQLGQLFAEAARQTLARNGLAPEAIHGLGSHGQTLYHQPPDPRQPDRPAFSLQIGDPNLISELTGITTVADFRRRDIAAGGQGAPLVPAFHREFFHSTTCHRIVLNVGGMANITVLRREGGHVPAFDTGPGNVLMDHWIQDCLGQSYDKDGAWAASGHCDAQLLAHLLNDDYFRLPPPKSTGREHFNAAWLQAKVARLPSAPMPADLQATLLALTVHSVADAVRGQLGEAGGEVLVCGGGARNQTLLQALAAALPGFRILDSSVQGLEADSVEATAFAWLAHKTLKGEAIDLRSITGSRRASVLGGIYPIKAY